MRWHAHSHDGWQSDQSAASCDRVDKTTQKRGDKKDIVAK